MKIDACKFQDFGVFSLYIRGYGSADGCLDQLISIGGWTFRSANIDDLALRQFQKSNFHALTMAIIRHLSKNPRSCPRREGSERYPRYASIVDRDPAVTAAIAAFLDDKGYAKNRLTAGLEYLPDFKAYRVAYAVRTKKELEAIHTTGIIRQVIKRNPNHARHAEYKRKWREIRRAAGKANWYE